MKKQRLNLPLTIITIIIIFLASFFIISYICRSFRLLGYFQIKEIIARGVDGVEFNYLKGKNIFSVDLKRQSRYILDSYPDCGKIKLVRVLPDKIFIDFIKRKPIALVKLYRYFAIDDEAVLFYAKEDLDLPIITGLETKIFGPKPGARYNIKELALVLGIIKEVNKNKILKHYKIRKIDIANPVNTSIFISHPQVMADYSKDRQKIIPQEAVEVKIGQEDIKDKITILAGLIEQEESELVNIKYIDLRFKEPVIKFNEAKTSGTK
jgi:cell division septal protein FtsQ